MKVLKKRIIAYAIDVSIIASIITPLHLFLTKFFEGRILIQIPLILLFFLRDPIFGNASIGQRLMGLRIYNSNWEKPGFFLLVKRSFSTMIFGGIIYDKAKRYDGNVLALFDYEREAFGTAVIETHIYKELKPLAEKMKGDFAENMTKLYNERLRNHYGN